MRVELKEKAKENLKGNWGQAITLVLLYLLISMAIGFSMGFIYSLFGLSDNVVSVLSSVTDAILLALFVLGMKSFYLKIARGEKATYNELFSKTNLFSAVLITTLLIDIYTTLWSLLFIIPGIIAAIKYSQVYYIMLDNPEISGNDAITMSKNMMNGHKMDYFLLCLSFIGWAILCLFTCGIGYLWLSSYIEVTMANFYDSIK